MNSLKILLGMLMNAAAVVTFIIAGLVHWQWTIVVAIRRNLGWLCRIARGAPSTGPYCQRLRRRGGACAHRLFLHETGVTETCSLLRTRKADNIMRTMRQVHFEGHGGPDVIKIGEAPVPEPGPGQVLIEVAAAGVNRPDCLQRKGVYPPPPGESAIPGLEIAGRVVARGEGVQRAKGRRHRLRSRRLRRLRRIRACRCASLPAGAAGFGGRRGSGPAGKLFHCVR